MDEEISIINTKTRNEKIKDFFIDNKKKLISIVLLLIFIILSFYSFQIYQDGVKKKISEKFNDAILEYKNGDKSKTTILMKEVILDEDSTYSPLALYFILDNNLIENKTEINQLFDILIDKTSLENEIRNLIIYKKHLSMQILLMKTSYWRY